jgi:hypothetical protein
MAGLFRTSTSFTAMEPGYPIDIRSDYHSMIEPRSILATKICSSDSSHGSDSLPVQRR